MLPRFLSLTSIALTLTTSAAKSLPRLDILDQAPIVQPSPHEVILPCAKCAFSEDSKCSEVIDRDSYLTINFSTENNTLLANQDAIFPSALPLEISAIRHSGSGQDEQVRLSYALETRPIPRSPDAELGDVYLLKLKLLDAFGRRASDHVIMVGLTTSRSPSESRPESDSLTITELSTSPLPPLPPPHHHHHSRPHPNDNINTAQSWLHAIKTTTKEYIHLLVHPYPPPPPSHRHYHQYPSNSTSPSTSNSQDNANANDDKSPDSKSKDPHRTLPHHNYRSHHPSWHGHGLHRGFGRIVKPVLLPAVLGAAAGVMACVVGFVVGRVVICVYRCVRGRMARGKDKGEVMGMSIGMGMDMGNGRMVRVPVVLRQGVDLDGYGRGDAGERERLLREFVIKDEDDVEDERWGV
ncbi:uncharacterized protein LDX57_012803 [Aspergillus melleus]|uniref:uncharacterized protein n=1 Tax=Aspergillus melleus TaxID=138277 RepID=UPI001E8E0A07|nr:uncharacterized protein LDX57_012803 [Aspergillus melleus]KAH8435174.1 hypothetical protein LDX57_012803 [Aspergillus melleus]